jgi:hypothetical protein
VKRFSIRVPNEVAIAAQQLAEIEGTSINQLVIDCLAERVSAARNDPKAKAKVEEQIGILREQYDL